MKQWKDNHGSISNYEFAISKKLYCFAVDLLFCCKDLQPKSEYKGRKVLNTGLLRLKEILTQSVKVHSATYSGG
jgi:hypothetical protein